MGKIVDTLQAQDAAIASMETDIATNLQKAEALRQSILKKAFSGELVPQDPADEPASVLLNRIRAGRASAGAPARGKRKPSTL
jgi:type I restriction enzyme S subunit